MPRTNNSNGKTALTKINEHEKLCRIMQRETFKKMSSDPCTIMRERAAIGIPNIIHRIHKFKRHELKHIITRGKKIKKKKKKQKHTSYDTTQHYLPTRRNPITSRWSSKSKKNYTKMLFSSYTPIT